MIRLDPIRSGAICPAPEAALRDYMLALMVGEFGAARDLGGPHRISLTRAVRAKSAGRLIVDLDT